MASTDNWHVHAGRDCCGTGGTRLVWPPLGFAETWFGGPYPVGQGQRRPLLGWQCSGCGRGYAPHVGECSHCGPVMETATSTNSCQPAREGGMCGCEDGDTP